MSYVQMTKEGVGVTFGKFRLDTEDLLTLFHLKSLNFDIIVNSNVRPTEEEVRGLSNNKSFNSFSIYTLFLDRGLDFYPSHENLPGKTVTSEMVWSQKNNVFSNWN